MKIFYLDQVEKCSQNTATNQRVTRCNKHMLIKTTLRLIEFIYNRTRNNHCIIQNMEYTVKEIADFTNTYKQRVVRFLKSNDIKPTYIEPGRKTKHYDESVLLQYVNYVNSKDLEETETTKTDTITLENTLELREKVQYLKVELEEQKELKKILLDTIQQQKEQVATTQKSMEIMQQTMDRQLNAKDEFTKHLKVEVEELKEELSKSRFNQEKMDQYEKIIDKITDDLNDQLDAKFKLAVANEQQQATIQSLQEQIEAMKKQHEADIQARTEPVKEETYKNLDKPEKALEQSKKGLFSRLFGKR